jgi:hypothetical protein
MDKKNYNEKQPESVVRNITFDVDNINFTQEIQHPIDVQWTVTDFTEKVQGIPNESIRQTLIETGVMFIGSEPPIIEVSNRLDYDLQSLSALHEELCMIQKVAECHKVEDIIIESMKNEELKPDFIKMRIRMFEALIELSPDVESFKQTYSLLLTKREKYCPEDK